MQIDVSRTGERHHDMLGVVGLLILLGACADHPLEPAADAVMGSSFAAHESVSAEVPLRGFLRGHDLSVTPQADGIRFVAIMTGSVSGLGRVTQMMDYILDYDLVHFAGSATITAASRDQLFLTFTGAIPGFAARDFPAPFTVDFEITGGTGRLAGSGGGGRMEGLGYGDGTFDGTYDGVRIMRTGPAR
jgi:hypothetical protein